MQSYRVSGSQFGFDAHKIDYIFINVQYKTLLLLECHFKGERIVCGSTLMAPLPHLLIWFGGLGYEDSYLRCSNLVLSGSNTFAVFFM